MKKLFVMLMILGMVSLTNAGVVDVVADGVGDMGHAGTELDRLEPGESIYVKIVINPNNEAANPPFKGYAIDLLEVDLTANTNATINIEQYVGYYGTYDAIGENADWDLTSFSDNGDSISLSYGDLQAINCGAAQVPVDLIWNLIVTVDENPSGDMAPVDLSLAGIVHVAKAYNTTLNSELAAFPFWNAVESELGDLTLYIVPEPMTIALLGLGGLFLRRRK